MRRAEPYELARPEPQRGGWESLQPMLGDERREDCNPWAWSDGALSLVYVTVLALIAVGVI